MFCRVINLDSRPDKMTEIPAEMDRFGVVWERFPAIDPYPGAGSYIGSSYSHSQVIKGITGLLLVCEDDVMFIDGARKLFDESFAQLPDDWDMLYLGGNVKMLAHRYSKNLFRISEGVHCTHAILYSEKARKTISDNFSITGEVSYYDHWLYTTGLAMMNCFICYPVVAYQRPSYSDARGGFMDYMSEMKENEKKHLI